jgi:beta-galactosidase
MISFMTRTRRLASFFALMILTYSGGCMLVAQKAPDTSWPGPGELYVGACYQPIDRSPAEIDKDIAFMKGAGFNVVRMGDLSWDSFEPRQGEFTFDWFDRIMDKMQAAGIRVILDIPGSPAPIWLHRAYPGTDIVNQAGDRVPPAERYMDDISDPGYRKEVEILANAMMTRYAHHPAVIAVGYNNEIGNGYLSYSDADRTALHSLAEGEVWDYRDAQQSVGHATVVQTASELRRCGHAACGRTWAHRSASSICTVSGPTKPSLSLRPLTRTASASCRINPPSRTSGTTPGAEDSTTSGRCDSYVSYGAEGFYPGDPVSGAFGAVMVKGDLPTPIWFNEFTAGGGGFYGTPGRSRMYAYLGLLLGSQATLAWTFNSHLGGEEQALFGLIDHDNTPSWKLAEFAHIAADFKRLEKLGFPRYPHPEVAIAYSFDSFVDSHPNGPSSTTLQYFKYPYAEQVQGAFAPFFRANTDVNVINIGHSDLSPYKLVVVPADFVMDQPSAIALRAYVSGGGTVVMTAFSAKVDEHGQWFNTSLPGRLSDVFGLKVNAFYETPAALSYQLGGTTYKTDAKFYEVIEPSTATTLATFSGLSENQAAITVNHFGKGNAIYVSMPSTASVMGPILNHLLKTEGIHRGPDTPEGVYARAVDSRILYVNTTAARQTINIPGTWQDTLSGKRIHTSFEMDPFGAELLNPEP